MIKKQKNYSSNTRIKARISKFYRSVLQKKTSLLSLTVFQLLILLLVINGGVAAIVMARHHSPVAVQDTSSNDSTNIPESKPDIPKPSTPSTPSSQGSTSAKPTNTTSDSGSTLDQYGCATNTPSYNQCVQNKRQLWCNGQISEPASAFSSATTKARAAYNSVMNEWESAQYQPTHSPKSEYVADATAKFNAIYEPAYSTYSAKVQSLNSQGCNLQYPSHESAGQYW